MNFGGSGEAGRANAQTHKVFLDLINQTKSSFLTEAACCKYVLSATHFTSYYYLLLEDFVPLTTVLAYSAKLTTTRRARIRLR